MKNPYKFGTSQYWEHEATYWKKSAEEWSNKALGMQAKYGMLMDDYCELLKKQSTPTLAKMVSDVQELNRKDNHKKELRNILDADSEGSVIDALSELADESGEWGDYESLKRYFETGDITNQQAAIIVESYTEYKESISRTQEDTETINAMYRQ